MFQLSYDEIMNFYNQKWTIGSAGLRLKQKSTGFGVGVRLMFRFNPVFVRSELNGEGHCSKVGGIDRFEWEIFNLLRRICGRVIPGHFIPA